MSTLPQNTIPTFTFVSDHGENITATGGGHVGYSHTDYSVFSENFIEHERYVLLPNGINYIMVD